MAKRHLKVTGDLGRVVFMVSSPGQSRMLLVITVAFKEYDLRNTPSLEESVRHSDIVFNLVGRNYPTKYVIPPVYDIPLKATTPSHTTLLRNFSLEDVHVEGAERIAEVVAKYDIDRFIHMSSYNANKDSPSEFFRTKARGEEVVRSIFPETTIVRPAPCFGFEDNLLHKVAGMTNLITSNRMQERFWPVHVGGQLFFFMPYLRFSSLSAWPFAHI